MKRRCDEALTERVEGRQRAQAVLRATADDAQQLIRFAAAWGSKRGNSPPAPGSRQASAGAIVALVRTTSADLVAHSAP